MSSSASLSQSLLADTMFDRRLPDHDAMSADDGHDEPLYRDTPLPVGVCAAWLIAGSLGCWGVILYVASLI